MSLTAFPYLAIRVYAKYSWPICVNTAVEKWRDINILECHILIWNMALSLSNTFYKM